MHHNWTWHDLAQPGYKPPQAQHGGRDDLSRLFLGLVWTVTALAALAMGLRTYARITKKRRRLAVDEWLAAAAVAFLVSLACMLAIGARSAGVGKHLYDLSWPQIVLFFKVNYISSLLYPLSLLFLRLSLLFSFRHLTTYKVHVPHYTRHATFSFLTLSIFVFIITILPTLTFCGGNMRDAKAAAVCYSPGRLRVFRGATLATGALANLLDLGIWAFLGYNVWRVAEGIWRWREVTGVLILGLWACVAGILHSAYTFSHLSTRGGQLADSTHAAAKTYACAAWHVGLGAIAACSPALRQLAARLLHGPDAGLHEPADSYKAATPHPRPESVTKLIAPGEHGPIIVTKSVEVTRTESDPVYQPGRGRGRAEETGQWSQVRY